MSHAALSDRAISTMVEIARAEGRDLNPEQRLEIDHLIADGLVESVASRVGGSQAYALSQQGQQVLDERGVGANES